MALVKYNNNSISDVTSVASISSGAMTLIKTLTISSGTSTVSFIHGSSDVVFDSTYPIYMFKWINTHHATADRELVFQGTTDGSNFNVTMTSTYFYAYHSEAGSSGFAYDTARDQSQGTGFQRAFVWSPSNDKIVTARMSNVISLNAGQTVNIYVLHTSTGTQASENYCNYFSMFRIGGV